jgi:hypothetical protein
MQNFRQTPSYQHINNNSRKSQPKKLTSLEPIGREVLSCNQKIASSTVYKDVKSAQLPHRRLDSTTGVFLLAHVPFHSYGLLSPTHYSETYTITRILTPQYLSSQKTLTSKKHNEAIAPYPDANLALNLEIHANYVQPHPTTKQCREETP